MKKPIVVAALLASAGACVDAPERVTSSDPFCAEVLPRVDAYLEAVRAEAPTPDDDRYGGTAVVGGIGEIADGMNAAVGADLVATQHHQFVNLMTLIDYDAQLAPRPYLAESWEVADDLSSVTFHLRRDVRWHDGEPTDAHDVAFTYRTVTNPATGFPNMSFWDHYDQSETGLEVIDDYTVRIGMRPHSEFLDPWRTLGILPEHLLGEVPPEQLKQHPYGTQCPVGNGPFVFWEHVPQDRWVFVANPGFPAALGGRPYLDRYVYRVVPEQTTLLADLLTENLDVYIAVRAEQAQDVIDNDNVELLSYTFRLYIFVGWNARRPQLSDARVRRAIAMATNREEVVGAILQGRGTIANSSVPPFHWAYEPEAAAGLAFDTVAAKALLAEAGWVDRDGDGVRENGSGLPLSFTIKYNDGNQQRQDVAEIMQSQLAKVGIDARPEVVEWTVLLEQITTPDRRDFDGVVMGWVPDFRLDDTDLFHSGRTDRPWAYAGTNNPELDRLLDTLSRTVDREAARPLWREYQAALAEEAPYTFFYFPHRLDGVNKRLRNVTMDVRGEWVNIKDWYIDPDSR